MIDSQQKVGSGERYSFYSLFESKVAGLEIPIIQRDYAQGRESSIDIREMFLDTLFQYLEENKPKRDLDFVYGSIRGSDDCSVFVPLDGQQRLTTLFLLHWYLAAISSRMNSLREILTKEVLPEYLPDGAQVALVKSKFTYETRASSSEFCDALMSHHIDHNNLLLPDDGKLNSLSKTIRDQGWYYLSWDHDPTIQSMLVMLDAIHNKFRNKPEYFDRLTDKQDPVVTFLYLDLKHFELTDDLYIKMNSRGKALTTFENFKAKFEQHIDGLHRDTSTKYILKYDDKPVNVTQKEYFSYNIDTTWADLFWNFRNINQKNNSCDDEIMNFVRVIISNQFASDCEADKNQIVEYLIGTQVAKSRQDYTDDISYIKYNSFKSLTEQAITYLISALDIITGPDNKLIIHLKDTSYYDELDIFKKVLQHNLTLTQRVAFHAYIKYLIINRGKPDGLFDWVRIIHNLTENRVIDGAEEVRLAIRSIDNLLLHSANILKYMSESNVKIEFFTARQVQEERIKAHLINKSKRWEESIKSVEKHPYFDGQIAFIIEFAGILEYFEKNENCLWSAKEDDAFFEAFTGYSAKAVAVFDLVLKELDQPESSRDFLWERAVLAKGDYLIEASSHRYNLLSSKANPRYYTWKRLLRLPPSNSSTEELELWHSRRAYVKEVLDDPVYDKKDVKASLGNICNVRLDDWRKYFVENVKLMRYCKQGFIRYESGAKIHLFRHSQQNHRHREMYTYNLYLTALSDSNKYQPFEWSHIEVRSSDEKSYAETNEWCYDKKHYAAYVKMNESNSASAKVSYVIGFRKTKGNIKQSDYSEDICKLLGDLNFKWNDDSKSYEYHCKSQEKTVTILSNMCMKMNEL